MDRMLVEQAQRGDREAFQAVAFALSDRLFGVAHRILRDFDAREMRSRSPSCASGATCRACRTPTGSRRGRRGS